MSDTDRRQAILDASARLFRHYGTQKTTMGEIAKAAEIAVGSLYLEFASKEDIVRALSMDVHTRILEEMRRISTKHIDDPRAALTAALVARTRAFLECKSDGPHACELAYCTQAGVKQAKEAFAASEIELLAKIIERGVAIRVFRKGDPREMAGLCLAAFFAVSPPALWSHDVKAAAKMAKDLAELLTRGLST